MESINRARHLKLIISHALKGSVSNFEETLPPMSLANELKGL